MSMTDEHAPDDDDLPDPLAGLSLRVRRFVEAYLGEAQGIGYKAAQLAGYSGTMQTLSQTASEILKKPEIRRAVSELVEHSPMVCSRVERLQRLSLLARGLATEERVTRGGEVVRVRVPGHVQLRALETLAKLAGDAHAELLDPAQVDRTVLWYPVPAPLGVQPTQVDAMWRASIGLPARAPDDDKGRQQ